MIDKEKITNTIASNLAHYRKLSNLKQSVVAEQIGYSDKAISKWERGDGLPDIVILHQLAEIYGVKVSDLLASKKLKRLPSSRRNHILITLLSVGLSWLVATVVFVLLLFFGRNTSWLNRWCYMPFIYAIPISFIILLVFNKIWGKRRFSFYIVSLLVWTCGMSLHLSFHGYISNAWLFYIVCIPLQILTVFWYLLRKKGNPRYTETSEE